MVYGMAGLIPFLAPPLAGILFPAIRPVAAEVLAGYSALILSFLGGARWGQAVVRPAPGIGMISLAMLPTLAGLALLLVPSGLRRAQLLALAVALALHWLWDITGANLPLWYSSLRTKLSAGAVAGLIAGAFVLPS
jgi:hypothetical protein